MSSRIDLSQFKQQPRHGDRDATKSFKIRWNDWLEFWMQKQVHDENELFDWRMSWGLVPRTFKEVYLDPSIQRGMIEPFGRPAKYRVVNSAGPEKRMEERFNVETMQTEMMEQEEPPEEFKLSEYARLKEINEVRKKMGLNPIEELPVR